MTIDEAMIQVRDPGVLQDDKKLRQIISAIFESGMSFQLSELRRTIGRDGPEALLDYRIDINAGRSHGMIIFNDGGVSRI